MKKQNTVKRRNPVAMEMIATKRANNRHSLAEEKRRKNRERKEMEGWND
jgi:hypothetical protein